MTPQHCELLDIFNQQQNILPKLIDNLAQEISFFAQQDQQKSQQLLDSKLVYISQLKHCDQCFKQWQSEHLGAMPSPALKQAGIRYIENHITLLNQWQVTQRLLRQSQQLNQQLQQQVVNKSRNNRRLLAILQDQDNADNNVVLAHMTQPATSTYDQPGSV